MLSKNYMSKPGGEVTKSVFSGPGRRLGDGKEILKSNKRKKTEDSDDDYSDSQEDREVAKGKKHKIEDSDDDDDYRQGEVRERHDLSHEAPKLYPKTQTRSGLRRGFYKYGEGRVLAESGLSYSGRKTILEPRRTKKEAKISGAMDSGLSVGNGAAVKTSSATVEKHDVGGSTANSA